jgi:signal transduction histidine kinase
VNAVDRGAVERLVRGGYPDALSSFVRDGAERDLARAYDLGRAAVAAGASHLVLVEVHHRALARLLADASTTEARARVLDRATSVLSEALAPFEMALRGFSDAVASLQQTNATLERTVAELRDALRVRDDFLSIASHELKTPLTGAKLHVDALLRRCATQPDHGAAWVVEPARAVQRNIERLARLADQLLDASAIAAGRIRIEPADVDLGEVVRAAAGELAAELRAAGCALTIDADDGVRGRWDPARLAQVVENLLSNVVKFGAGAPVEITVRASGAGARLAVRDHGAGISDADRPRLFGRFERFASVRSYGGFGLGLWVTRQLVEAMGGTIAVDSAPGRGATFTVELPAQGGAALGAPSPAGGAT